MTYTCRKCDQNLPAESFNFKNKTAGKLKKICKSCESLESQLRYLQNKDSKKAAAVAWKDKNKDKFLAYQKQYNDNKRKNKNKIRESIPVVEETPIVPTENVT